MKGYRWLAWLPFIGILGGVFCANRVTPYVFGLPFLLFWCVMWVILASIIMAIIFKNDPENKESDEA